MQRSRKALLQRRAALERGIMGKKRLFKVSLSLIVLIWGIIFLLKSLIRHGNGSGGGVVGESSWHEASLGPNEGSDFGKSSAQSDTPHSDDQRTPGRVGEASCILPVEDDDISLSIIGKEQSAEDSSDIAIKVEKETAPKRLSRIAPPGLDEFKGKSITAKEKHLSGQKGSVILRVEPGGKEYNYASATKGARVLASNKEAKGAPNILGKDKDKYLRNPCSAEEKYVVIELSEETLVDTISIANFEHYSSNLKDFELLSSLSYPTDNWTKLANLTYGNVKHDQRFALAEPKWARYLRLNLLNHYGSEFYCTLSVVEVYGVDAVESLLEDMISAENKRWEPEEPNDVQMPLKEPANGDDLFKEFFAEVNNDAPIESLKTKLEAPTITVPNLVVESRPQQVGRMPGDTVLKILMQKVQSLDVSFSVLERYLEELNIRYGDTFKEFDGDIENQDHILEKIRLQIINLEDSKDNFASDIMQLLSWKSLVSSQMNQLVQSNAILRLEVERIHSRQVDTENRGLAVVLLSFVFGCLATSKLFIGVFVSLFRVGDDVNGNSCRTSSGWLLLLLSSVIVASIQWVLGERTIACSFRGNL